MPEILEPVPWLDSQSIEFPSIHSALDEPANGLLAIGGDLSPERLSNAYRKGIFPWSDQDQPLLWWSPDPRAVLFPDDFKITKSLAKTLKKNRFEVRLNQNFMAVVDACSAPRKSESGTWITPEMKFAYGLLHQRGLAHSIECYLGSTLVGGLYGIAMGKLFFGESMFQHETDASKVAFAFLVRLLKAHHCPLIDCQVPNPHLESLGATCISRTAFERYLKQYIDVDDPLEWNLLADVFAPW